MNPSTFDDIGIDAMTGSEIMGLLALQPYQLNDPIIFNRISEVVNYMKNVPDKAFFVNRITAGKPVDKLNHVWSYIQVLNKEKSLNESLHKLSGELSSFSEKLAAGVQLSDVERLLAADVSKQKASTESELNRIREEKFVYEK